MKRDFLEDGRVRILDEDIFEMMFNQNSWDAVVLPDTEEVREFKAQVEKFYYPTPVWIRGAYIEHKSRTETWLVDPQVFDFDIEVFLLEKCKDSKQIERVKMELELYKIKGLMPILQLFHHIVQELLHKKVLWGVGRGSSTHSYCLFLLGVHHIDSLRYDLDPTEFLKPR